MRINAETLRNYRQAVVVPAIPGIRPFQGPFEIRDRGFWPREVPWLVFDWKMECDERYGGVTPTNRGEDIDLSEATHIRGKSRKVIHLEDGTRIIFLRLGDESIIRRPLL